MKLFGHFRKSNNYRRYVNVCHARSGSNLLLSYMANHPHIDTHSEIFKLLHGKTIAQVYDELFGNKPLKIRAAGCKVFYDHPFDGNPEELLNFLIDRHEHYFIHLVREDKLKAFISFKIAMQTNVWQTKAGEPRPVLESRIVNIDPEEARTWIVQIREWEEKTRNRLRNAQYLEITYEQLVSNPQDIMDNVFSFLDLSTLTVKTAFVPMNPEPIHMLVSNYDQLVNSGLLNINTKD